MDQSAEESRPSSDPVRWVLFVSLSVLFGLSMFYRSSVAVLATDLMRDVPMDLETLSLASASFFYTYALLQIPGGMLLDRFNPAKVLTGFFLTALAGAILFGLAESPVVLVLGRLLMGAGMACGFIGTLKILFLHFSPDRFATLSGVVVSVGNLGIVAATTPLVLWAQGLGWRTTFLLVGLFHLAVTLVFVFSSRAKRRAGEEASAAAVVERDSPLRGLFLVLKDRQARLISGSVFIRYGVLAAFQGLWAGPYLMDVMECSPLTAGNILLLLTLGVVIGNPVSGFLSDRVFRKRKGIMVVSLTGYSLTLAALACVPVGAPLWLLALLFAVFGLFAGTATIPYAHLRDLTPPERSATALTVINFFAVVGAGVFTQGLGFLMKGLHPGSTLGIEAFGDAFLACSICMGIAAALYSITREGHGKGQAGIGIAMKWRR